MAKFSSKGWSSDLNLNNFSSDQLERFKDGIRDDMAGRHDSAAKPRRAHETAGYVSGFGRVEIWKGDDPNRAAQTRSFAAELAAARIAQMEDDKRKKAAEDEELALRLAKFKRKGGAR